MERNKARIAMSIEKKKKNEKNRFVLSRNVCYWLQPQNDLTAADGLSQL